MNYENAALQVRSAAARVAAEAGAGLVEVRILDVLEDRHRLVQRVEAGLAAGMEIWGCSCMYEMLDNLLPKPHHGMLHGVGVEVAYAVCFLSWTAA